MRKSFLLLLLALSLATMAYAQAVRVGDIFCDDNSFISPSKYPSSGKTAVGVVFYVSASDDSGWVVSLQDQTSSSLWSGEWYYGYDLEALPNYPNARTAMYDLDGYYNTGVIRDEGDKYSFPAAWAVDYENGWYLPSAGQLRHLFSCAADIESSLLAAGGQPFSFREPNYYWSSSEFTGYHAYDMNSAGSLGDYVKDNHINYPIYGISVRAVKDFQVTSPTPHDYHMGDVITNPDGSRGILFYITPDQSQGWMVALNDAIPSVQWGDATNVPNLPDQVLNTSYGALLLETDGLANTEAIVEYMSGANTVASMVNLDDGWYVPTAGQLSKLFGALCFVEVALSFYGTPMSYDYYWSSSEANASQAYVVSFRPEANTRAGGFLLMDKQNYCCVRLVRNIDLSPLPLIGQLQTPAPICGEEPLDLELPHLVNAEAYGWEIASNPSFDHPITYEGQILSEAFNGWYLRLWASNENGTVYSNIVEISIHTPSAYHFSVQVCDPPFEWNGHIYTESGSYQQTFNTLGGCDSVITLNLTIKPTPMVGEIQGQEWISSDFNGNFTYAIDEVPGCYGYEWNLAGGLWPITYTSTVPECTIHIYGKGKDTLKVKLYTDCGIVERSLLIHHDEGPRVTIYPNPTDDDITLELFGLEGETTIIVHNPLGTLMDVFTVNVEEYKHEIPYTLKGKACGLYLFTIVNHHNRMTKKVVKRTGGTYGISSWW